MINAEMIATVERKSHILPKMAFVWKTHTSNSTKYTRGENPLFSIQKMADYTPK